VHKDNEKNNVTCERGEPSNDGVRHYRLRRNKYLPCLLKLHIDRGDTRATDMHQNHRCSTTLLLAPDQQLVGWLLGYAPRPRPNPKYSGFCGRQRSECRFCFFITDKGEDFVHLGFANFGWNRRIGQRFCRIGYPQRNRLR
jgi:hypothetical protein